MRFFIAFLMVSCFYLSTAKAMDNSAIEIVQKSNKKTTLILDKVNVLAKKEISSLRKEPFSEHVNRIHHTIQQPTFISTIGFLYSYLMILFAPIQSIKKFKGKVNYSYQFIFNCLFPKHTFW
ncbi:hypothetical protein [Pedobacter boryungensis]|uniref:Uncharacterized protein n=1 Tax=Pedobacter boryungensis TaxID=869962 RepID=A0ABX2DG53_9SPHI|nr:hypothetical protein [Pedobacter boryungensis]NQX33092.1 hypothetical protein [Pedobacter boryungensis]